MKTESSIEIDAPAEVVWAVFTDVEGWPGFTASVTALRALDGVELKVGRRYEIKQPRLPKLTWVVTSVDPGRAWTWEQRTPGNRTAATHEVVALDGGRTAVRQVIEQTGPAGVLTGLLMRRTTRRYLQMEAEGLKQRSESRRSADAGADAPHG